MAPKLSAKQMIREGLEDAREELRDAARVYLQESYACHCCCCTGECSRSFEDSTEEEQEAWMLNYWADVSLQVELELDRFHNYNF